MKTCPVCELDLEDSYLFCPDDGSTLNFISGQSSVSESPRTTGADDETAGAVVLYCPACAAEYPLTFTSCPVHGMKLTKHRIPRLSKLAPSVPVPVPDGRLRQEEPSHTNALTTLDLKPGIERPIAAAATETDDFTNDSGNNPGIGADDFLDSDPVVGNSPSTDYQNSTLHSQESKLERPGFRVAAIATVVALAVFGLAAVYSLVSNFSRRSPASIKAAGPAQGAPQSLPFVATPQEARDYKEETQDLPATAPEQPSEPVERVRRESVPAAPTELAMRKSPPAEPLRKAPEAAPVPVTRVSNPAMPPLPRGNAGGFDARLIRLRSRKTTAGVRYDLTFNMQEQAGRAAHWQRVLINTRSINGASHSQAIPFSHRLGATGALTFTISVEMTGRSEADWQGRVLCTALGWDNKGAPLQANFGANVTP